MKIVRNPIVIFVCCFVVMFGTVLLQSLSGPDLAEAAKGGQPKVSICHYDSDTNTFHQISIATPAIPAHIAHGDAALGGACSAGIGECANDGVYVCDENGAVCNAVSGDPLPEVCDTLDNDCDASSDEDLGQTTCGLGVCQRTVDNCVIGEPQECTPGTAGSEICNGLDDDCDGFVDEDFPSTPTACGTGLCAAAGSTSCINGVVVDSCVAGSPSTETCNNFDDDCNGTVDSMTGSCYSGPVGTAGVGACHTGSQTCSAGAWGACSGQVVPVAEQCNGIDDDCDGVVDDVTGIGSACTGGGTNTTGVCTANYTCTGIPGPGPNGLTCTQSVSPTTEVCNELDDNCNGSVDEGLSCQ